MVVEMHMDTLLETRTNHLEIQFQEIIACLLSKRGHQVVIQREDSSCEVVATLREGKLVLMEMVVYFSTGRNRKLLVQT
jgi:hypothetical protein